MFVLGCVLTCGGGSGGKGLAWVWGGEKGGEGGSWTRM